MKQVFHCLLFGVLFIACSQNSHKDAIIGYSDKVQLILMDTIPYTPLVDALKRKVMSATTMNSSLEIMNELTEVIPAGADLLNNDVISLSFLNRDTINFYEGLIQKAIIYGKTGHLDAADSVLNVVVGGSTTSRFNRQLAKSISLLGEGDRLRGNYNSALNNYHIALKIALDANDFKRTGYCYHKIGIIMKGFGKADSGYFYCLKALTASKKAGDILRVCSIYGWLSENSNSLQTASKFLDSMEVYSILTNDKEKIVRMFLTKGEVNGSYNNYGSSIENALKGHELALKINDTVSILDASQVLSQFYIDTKEYNRALLFARSGFRIAELEKYQYYKKVFQIKLGQAYLEKGEATIGLAYLNTAKGTDSGQDFLNSLIARGKVETGDTIGGISLLMTVIKNADGNANNNILAYSNNYLGSILLKKKFYAEALNAFQKGQIAGFKAGIPEHIMDSYKGISTIYDNTGQKYLSWLNQNLFYKLKDSTSRAEKIKEVEAITYRTKEDKLRSEQAIRETILKNEQSRKNDELRFNRTLLYIFIGAFFTVGILFLYIFKLLKVSRIKSNLIAEQKRVVEEKQEEILDSIRYAKRIQTALLTSEKYIARNLNNLIKNT
jgi:tetratricopeptide (TPR) repeat protein